MIPDNAISLVKRWEGLHKLKEDGLYHPYVCPAGVWTIGYGSTRDLDGTPITENTPPKTAEECEFLMREELGRCVKSVILESPNVVDRPEILGSLASFVFNLGIGSYRRSTLRRKINVEDWEASRFEIRKWVWGGGRRLPGLIARRNAEAEYLYG